MRRCIVSVAGVAGRLLLVGALFGAVATGTGVPRASAASSFTYTVNSTGDTNDTNLSDHACDGTCTLRSALEQANANCSADPTITTAIQFAIPGSGVRTITPFPVTSAGPQNHPAALPNISCPVIIDGTTQGGARYTGPPLIELDGSVAATTQLAPGLGFGGNVNGSTVRGLIVDRWNGFGLQFAGKGGATAVATFVAQGNYIGTDPTGSQASPNRNGGIFVNGPARAVIGGSTATDRNIVSGNNGRGIAFGPSSATGSQVQGNYIGTDITGARGIANTQDGIYFNGGNGATIGGTTAGTGNVISGNGGDGFATYGTSVGSFQIIGNRIGTTADGAGRLGNSGDGAAFLNSGGNDLVRGNTIAYNGRAGITVALGTGHRITGNSIFDNSGLGIDLDPCTNANCPGVNPNDAGDGDSGPNLFQNYPVISAVTSTDTTTTITGTLNSTANAPFTVEVFTSPACDDSGYGEAKKYLGSADVTTSGNNANFSVTVSPRLKSSAVTATATDASGNTSELSACRSAPK